MFVFCRNRRFVEGGNWKCSSFHNTESTQTPAPDRQFQRECLRRKGSNWFGIRQDYTKEQREPIRFSFLAHSPLCSIFISGLGEGQRVG